MERKIKVILYILIILLFISCNPTLILDQKSSTAIEVKISYTNDELLKIDYINMSNQVQELPPPFTAESILIYYDKIGNIVYKQYANCDVDQVVIRPNSTVSKSFCIYEILSRLSNLKGKEKLKMKPKIIQLDLVNYDLKSNSLKIRNKSCQLALDNVF